MKLTLRMTVACTNAGGEPDLYFCKVTGTEEQYEEGLFYDYAKIAALEQGYEAPMVAFDERDYAGEAMLSIFDYATADTTEIGDSMLPPNTD